MVKIGMMIGGRYEIQEKIGTGGMSDVYKAKDHKLNRLVAVKVLKQEFSENENFVSKFRVEAQAAAGLMHSNIVNVYDVGEENGIYYIVMELVEGITLKKYIEKKVLLSYKEAVSIAIQISLGIEAAHNNHIIHRDIKPQNIIISKDGKVKVTDFGIAKAATSNTITSNVMGSVHYTSPEQARGGYSDEKSDIYSLGITLFEMLTGRVPFNGDTTVAIAIKHIQEEMPSPRELVPEIPASVEGIVLKCCKKSPDRRYQNMKELVADLKQALLNPDEEIAVAGDEDLEGETRAVTEEEVDRIKMYSSGYEEEPYENEVQMRLKADNQPEDPEEYYEERKFDENKKAEIVTTLLAVLGGVVILVILVILAVRLMEDREESKKSSSGTRQVVYEESETFVDMPDIVGHRVEDARNTLSKAGLYMTVTYEESLIIDQGVVIRTGVEAGTTLKTGTSVNVVVSAGTNGVEVPAVEGHGATEAENSLVSRGFLVNRTDVYSNTVEEGKVISQTPNAGSKAPEGSVVTIRVSKGKENTMSKVPNLIGKPLAEAINLLTEAGLTYESVNYIYDATIPAGNVCSQNYSAGTYLPNGSAVSLSVSQGEKAIVYKCNVTITAPTAEEAPDYVLGTEVALSLVTDDGQVLLDTKTSTFPQTPNYYGLTASGGTLTFKYTVTVGGSTSVDPVTGETVVNQGTQEERSFTRRIEFTPDN